MIAVQSSASLDANREYALDLLARAYVVGELDAGELERRAERALTAATTAELDGNVEIQHVR